MKIKRKSSALLLVPALGLALAGPALAAGEPRAGINATASTSDTRPALAQRRANDGALTSITVEGKPMFEARASKLMGMNVRNPQGESLGEIQDFVVDINGERVQYAVIAFGGFLGLGEKLFAFPLQQFNVGSDGKLVLNVDREKLKRSPGFERNRWPDWNRANDPYRGDLARAYGQGSAPATGAQLRRASDLLDAEVNDRNGREVGDVKDIVVHLPSGRVHYVVVEYDKAWNPNDKLVAVPLRALSANPAATADRNVATAPPRTNAARPGDPNYESLRGGTAVDAPNTTASGDRTAAGALLRPGPEAPNVAPVPDARRDAHTTANRVPRVRAMDDDLVFRGTREDLANAPEFDRDRYPDLRDAARRQDFDKRLSRW